MQQLKNPALFQQSCFIDGKWIAAKQNQVISVFNPYNDALLGTVPKFGSAETKTAIQSANDAWRNWSALTPSARAEIMQNWAKLIDENKEDLATIMTLEQGKAISESRGEIDYANSFIKWFAEEGKRIYGDTIPSSKIAQHLIVIKQPIGVVGAITPWNFPAAMITRKCAPALAAGCTIILKPACETPFTALALVELARQAGFPPGVINIVTGDAEQIGKELTSNSLVRKISFTGSTKVGKILMKQCASSIKKVSLELGGNAPFIVFENANLDKAITGLIASKFRNSGQTCVCANRVLVQDSIYDLFQEKLLHAVKRLKTGNGLDAQTELGPLINEQALQKVQRHVQDALDNGATLICGGKPIPTLGKLFFEPTILSNANEHMLISKEETFGPVAALFRFHTEEEAIAMANNTEFGLASYFYSDNIHQVWRVAEALEAGMVGVNAGIISTEVAPFGGIKESGIGREGSKYGIEEYVEIKYLCMQ